MNIYIGYVAFVRACQDKEGKILLTQSIKQVVQDDRLSYGDAEIVGNAQAAKQIQNVEVLYDLHGKAIRVELSLQLVGEVVDQIFLLLGLVSEGDFLA